MLELYKQILQDIADSREAKRAKSEPVDDFNIYIKNRWGKSYPDVIASN